MTMMNPVQGHGPQQLARYISASPNPVEETYFRPPVESLPTGDFGYPTRPSSDAYYPPTTATGSSFQEQQQQPQPQYIHPSSNTSLPQPYYIPSSDSITPSTQYIHSDIPPPQSSCDSCCYPYPDIPAQQTPPYTCDQSTPAFGNRYVPQYPGPPAELTQSPLLPMPRQEGVKTIMPLSGPARVTAPNPTSVQPSSSELPTPILAEEAPEKKSSKKKKKKEQLSLKTRSACDECARTKVRCVVEGGICTRCKKKNLVCKFSQTKKRGPKGNAATAAARAEASKDSDSYEKRRRIVVAAPKIDVSSLVPTLLEYLRLFENADETHMFGMLPLAEPPKRAEEHEKMVHWLLVDNNIDTFRTEVLEHQFHLYVDLCFGALLRGHPPRVIEFLEQAKRLVPKIGDAATYTLAKAYSKLMRFHVYAGELDEAHKYNQLAREVCKKLRLPISDPLAYSCLLEQFYFLPMDKKLPFIRAMESVENLTLSQRCRSTMIRLMFEYYEAITSTSNPEELQPVGRRLIQEMDKATEMYKNHSYKGMDPRNKHPVVISMTGLKAGVYTFFLNDYELGYQCAYFVVDELRKYQTADLSYCAVYGLQVASRVLIKLQRWDLVQVCKMIFTAMQSRFKALTSDLDEISQTLASCNLNGRKQITDTSLPPANSSPSPPSSQPQRPALTDDAGEELFVPATPPEQLTLITVKKRPPPPPSSSYLSDARVAGSPNSYTNFVVPSSSSSSPPDGEYSRFTEARDETYRVAAVHAGLDSDHSQANAPPTDSPSPPTSRSSSFSYYDSDTGGHAADTNPLALAVVPSSSPECPPTRAMGSLSAELLDLLFGEEQGAAIPSQNSGSTQEDEAVFRNETLRNFVCLMDAMGGDEK